MGRRVARRDRKDPSRPLAAILLAAALVESPCAVHAADGCGLGLDDRPVHIAMIAETFDVALDDGRVLRLAGLDLAVPPVPASGAVSPSPSDARRTLQAWAGAGPVVAHALSATPDRWGRIPVLPLPSRRGRTRPRDAAARRGARPGQARTPRFIRASPFSSTPRSGRGSRNAGSGRILGRVRSGATMPTALPVRAAVSRRSRASCRSTRRAAARSTSRSAAAAGASWPC